MNTLRKIWEYRDLRNRIFITLGLLLLVRILAHIPMPGVDIEQLRTFLSRNQIFGLLNMFSGGTMENFSIILMGVGPYITASIIMKLLVVVIHSIEALKKEILAALPEKVEKNKKKKLVPVYSVNSESNF